MIWCAVNPLHRTESIKWKVLYYSWISPAGVLPQFVCCVFCFYFEFLNHWEKCDIDNPRHTTFLNFTYLESKLNIMND